ncbi:MAG: DUF6498-containing protein [Alphaproteobacteria bacterium]|jgi:hypothetical protein|nr:DUF6498-containing protein [Alphaproteobacteria bacterium]
MLFRAVPLLGILLVNAIPLIGVLWFGWSVFEVLFLYWFENVAIGITHALRMEISTRTNTVADGRSTTTFFMLHYGMFTLVHGVFVITLFGVVAGGLRDIGPGFLAPVLAIIGWQIAFLILDTIRTQGFQGRTPDALMFEPYPRVLALHITVLAGGWLVGEMGSPIWALAILVGIKTAFDLGIAWLTSPATGNPTGVFRALRKPRD